MARPKKEPGKKYVRQNISMEPEQLRQAMELCQQTDRALSWLVRQAMAAYLKQNCG